MNFAFATPTPSTHRSTTGPVVSPLVRPNFSTNASGRITLSDSKLVIRSLRTSAPQPPPLPPLPPLPRSSTSQDVMSKLSALSVRAQSIKCPFWRRRFTDSLDVMLQVVTWAVRTRHKSLPLPVLPSSHSSHRGRRSVKHRDLDMASRLAIIRDDFIKRQYYVTGRLTTDLYRDDCLFDGPDPDGHVRGVYKFCDAAAGLFDKRLSRVDLIDIYIRDSCHIVAEWRLQGALMLPWRPYIKPYLGSTVYEFDESGLISSHVETWQISVYDAFLSVIWKGFGAAPAPPADVVREQKRRTVLAQSIGSFEVE